MSDLINSLTGNLGIDPSNLTESAEKLLEDKLPGPLGDLAGNALKGGGLDGILEKVGLGGHHSEGETSEKEEGSSTDSDEDSSNEDSSDEDTSSDDSSDEDSSDDSSSEESSDDSDDD